VGFVYHLSVNGLKKFFIKQCDIEGGVLFEAVMPILSHSRLVGKESLLSEFA
jgi:hypothetical protein